MSRQAMALFDAVTAPGAAVLHMAWPNDHPSPLTKDELDTFKSAHRVWVDESLHQRVNFTADVVDFASDFGELMLPYPHMWIEWINERDGDRMHVAIQCFETSPQQKGEHSYLMVPWVILPAENERWRGVPAEYDEAIRVDFDGTTILGVSGYRRHGNGWSVLPENTEANRNSAGTSLASVIDLVWNGFVAIGFMNCKNVAVERHDRTPVKTKKQRRTRPPKLDYHTIVLPSPRSASSAGSSDSQGMMARHQVRGHFKSYTEDAPLMGKHVGTYWWGWQVRGNKENGIVVSDYKVGAA